MSLSRLVHLAQCYALIGRGGRPYVIYVNANAKVPLLRLPRAVPRLSLADASLRIVNSAALLRRALYLSIVYAVPIATAPVLLIGQRDRSTREWWWATLRAAINAAGPCSMKFAQWAATRVDLFPEEMCSELSQLHYQAKTHGWNYTEQVLDKRNPSWRQEWEFLNFKRPVGSGCVAQVYKARIDGKLVAVKVVHPRVRQEIRADVEIMQAVTSFLEWWPRWQFLSLRESVDEFADLMTRQLNMKDEANNLARFRHYHNDRLPSDDEENAHNGDDSLDDVVFPKPWMHLTSDDVLVESFHEGVHMADVLQTADPETRRELARKGLQAFLKMLFEDNFVHADLHPGNILVCNRNHEPSQADDSLGHPSTVEQDHQLIFLDVGLVTSLNDYDRKSFVQLFQAVIKGNGYKVGRLMIDRSRGGPGPRTDEHAFCTEMEIVVNEVLQRGFSLGKVHFAELLERVLKLCYVHKVKLESHFTNILLSFAIVEGMGRRLDPDMDILKSAAPYVFAAALKYKRMV